MLETLLEILSWDLPSREILLEEDGDICLSFVDANISINNSGGVNWAIMLNRRHGTSLSEFKELMHASPTT